MGYNPDSANRAKHAHSDTGHNHGVPKSQKHLRFALAITFGFAFVELVGGVWSGSLALISDAGHMMTDSAALLLALIANVVGQRAANASKTYGYARAELIGALVNSITMIMLVVWIIVEAVQRLQDPVPVNGLGVMVIAVIGLLVNLVSAWQLSNDHDNLNSRGALIHVMGDLLGSVAAIVAGAVIYFTGWSPIDPLLSVAVSLLILRSTFTLLKRTLHLLMDGVPEEIDLQQLNEDMSAITGIVEVHDLHVWNLGGKRNALSAHLVITDPKVWSQIIVLVTTMLQDKYQIDHATIQPAWQGQGGEENVPIIRSSH
ncbi:cation diffusion facilitator family transporter [Shewanella mangrovisoli]|uniref:cation diffusion facilitator family transporter n=1 Tax=Shewanella mangrovisoli TaxID=2864211 RepID=UPI00313B2119